MSLKNTVQYAAYLAWLLPSCPFLLWLNFSILPKSVKKNLQTRWIKKKWIGHKNPSKMHENLWMKGREYFWTGSLCLGNFRWRTENYSVHMETWSHLHDHHWQHKQDVSTSSPEVTAPTSTVSPPHLMFTVETWAKVMRHAEFYVSISQAFIPLPPPYCSLREQLRVWNMIWGSVLSEGGNEKLPSDPLMVAKEERLKRGGEEWFQRRASLNL